MVFDRIGNELQVGDIVWQIDSKKIAEVAKLYSKSITTTDQIKESEKLGTRLGHIPGIATVKVVIPGFMKNVKSVTPLEQIRMIESVKNKKKQRSRLAGRH